MDNTFISVLTGQDHMTPPSDVKSALVERARVLLPSLKQEHPQGHDACYDGSRCEPENLAWRIRQNAQGWIRQAAGHGPQEDREITVELVSAGEIDDLIEYTYHDAATAEHYYRFEKDWD